jgi:hypothetical protein
VSKQRGGRSNRKYSDEKIEVIKTLVVAHYYDFGPKFAAEKLYEKHGIKISKETLRQWMVDWGLWKAKRQKQARIHPQRERRDWFGELIQIDGSPHPWFEERGPKCCLQSNSLSNFVKVMQIVISLFYSVFLPKIQMSGVLEFDEYRVGIKEMEEQLRRDWSQSELAKIEMH